MNSRQLVKLGVPEESVHAAIVLVQEIAKYNHTVPKDQRYDIKNVIQEIISAPDYFAVEGGGDGTFAYAEFHARYGVIYESTHKFAASLIEERDFIRPEPASYKTWGDAGIDKAAHEQMKAACAMPNAFRGALMPDAHLGYGLPIGGVIALTDAVSPHAVGVDIGCSMKVSIIDHVVLDLDKKLGFYSDALERGTRFGMGVAYEGHTRKNHSVMDQDWNVSRITREKRDIAWSQLGTSGSGNHFAEWGIVTVPENPDPLLGLAPGEYVALMSHSGSRGPGNSVCKTYDAIARSRLPKRYEDLCHLAWLDMNTEEGQEYWAAMNLMGDYAAANHEVIHQTVLKLVGGNSIGTIKNLHNFAWKEEHDGKTVYVHRKGATPAGKGVLGVIPGSMGTPAYIVKGLGNQESLNSASHGAGRLMSRRAGKDKYNFKAVREDLVRKGITILSAGADEVPGVYKPIDEVMACQTDLVTAIARFDPKIVKMCGDGSDAED